MSEEEIYTENEKKELEQAIEESKKLSDSQALKMETDLQETIEESLKNDSHIQTNCNKSEYYLQNRGQGNCLFEAVAQIFYPIDVKNISFVLSIIISFDELKSIVFDAVTFNTPDGVEMVQLVSLLVKVNPPVPVPDKRIW